jgi:hypothetical protein
MSAPAGRPSPSVRLMGDNPFPIRAAQVDAREPVRHDPHASAVRRATGDWWHTRAARHHRSGAHTRGDGPGLCCPSPRSSIQTWVGYKRATRHARPVRGAGERHGDDQAVLVESDLTADESCAASGTGARWPAADTGTRGSSQVSSRAWARR